MHIAFGVLLGVFCLGISADFFKRAAESHDYELFISKFLI